MVIHYLCIITLSKYKVPLQIEMTRVRSLTWIFICHNECHIVITEAAERIPYCINFVNYIFHEKVPFRRLKRGL